MKMNLAVVLATLILCSVGASAQMKVLTLDDARKVALERNLNVVQAQNNVSAANASVMAAYGQYLPSVSASGSWSRTQTDRVGGTQIIGGTPVALPATTSTTGNFSTSIGASYNIFDGFARGASVGQANSNATSTEQTSVRTRQSIVFQTESGYLNVLRNEQLVLVTEENLKRDRRQLERIVESNKVGALSLADVYRQQSAVAADELSLITAQNTYDKSKADMIALIGLDPADDYKFEDATVRIDVDTLEMNATMEKYKDMGGLTKRALTARPDFIAANENYNAAESGVTISRSNYFPSIGASARWSAGNEEFSTMTDNRSINWGISINWTLFDGFSTNQRIQSAQAQRRNAQINLAQAERGVAVDVRKGLLDLDAARKQYEVSMKGLVSATEDRKIAEERYNLGAGTLLDLLTANANLVQAQANKVNATYNYTIAKLNVEYVLGEKTY